MKKFFTITAAGIMFACVVPVVSVMAAWFYLTTPQQTETVLNRDRSGNYDDDDRWMEQCGVNT